MLSSLIVLLLTSEPFASASLDFKEHHLTAIQTSMWVFVLCFSVLIVVISSVPTDL
jgi:hypothetical protein